MKLTDLPKNYEGREQAFIKHTILKAYLQRLFMVVGQRKEFVINYIDCFSGPWKEGDTDNLSDTSIGISLEQMSQCSETLRTKFNREVKFRALYIEKESKPYKKLDSYLSNFSHTQIETECFNDDYTKLFDEIVGWCGNNFSFFFVDPKGWQQIIGAKTMRPLLNLDKTEFLINLMYDFVNRFVSVERHSEDMVELFGEVPNLSQHSPDERQKILLNLYRNNLKKYYKGRTAYVPVEKPGVNKVLYYLVYLTRNPIGINVFKKEAEGMELVQNLSQSEVRLRKQIENSNMDDLFGNESLDANIKNEYSDNRLLAKEYLLSKLSDTPLKIDYELWADFLEDSDLYPTDFQMAMKELVNDKVVKNLDSDVNRRTKNIIKPNWNNKSERWVLV